MSYDLHLLRRDTISDDPSAAYERLEEIEAGPPTPEEEQRLRQLAADLQAASPGLDLTETAEGYPFCLQLGYMAERPIVIDIGGVDDVTMMWSYGAEDAGPALDEVKLYLPVFERYGYVAFDPQLDRLFDVNRDSPEALHVHADAREMLGGSDLAELVSLVEGLDADALDGEAERPSFWKRLFRR